MKYESVSSKYIGLIEEVRKYFLNETQTIYAGRNSLKVFSYNNTDVIVKSFKIPHLINKVAYTFFRDSKAKKSYKHALKIDDFTPRPIGYVEYFQFGLIGESYYVSENYKYDFTIREALLENDFKNKRDIFNAFAAFTFSLHNYNIEHLDYSPGNILIKELENGYEFKIVDINRMRFRRLSPHERLENFSKLWAKDEDLTFIAEAYAKLIDMDRDEAVSIALKASQKHKDKKNLKKRLKGEKVVD